MQRPSPFIELTNSSGKVFIKVHEILTVSHSTLFGGTLVTIERTNLVVNESPKTVHNIIKEKIKELDAYYEAKEKME